MLWWRCPGFLPDHRAAAVIGFDREVLGSPGKRPQVVLHEHGAGEDGACFRLRGEDVDFMEGKGVGDEVRDVRGDLERREAFGQTFPGYLESSGDGEMGGVCAKEVADEPIRRLPDIFCRGAFRPTVAERNDARGHHREAK